MSIPFVVCCASTAADGSEPSPLRQCFEIYQHGIFNEETFRCFPDLEERLREPLCRSGLTTHPELVAVGFGIGTEVYGQTVEDGRGGVLLDEGLTTAWRRENCGGAGSEAVPMTSPEALPLFESASRTLPPSLLGPWLFCRDAIDSLESDGKHPARQGGILCALIGSHDTSGENGALSFEATFLSESWFGAGTTLAEDLVVEGAQCDAPWERGSRVSVKGRVLRCSRLGRSAVRIRLETKAGTCERGLPELVEPPWRERCAEVGREAIGSSDGSAAAPR